MQAFCCCCFCLFVIHSSISKHKSQVFILAANRNTSLHLEQLLAALNFKVLAASLEQVLQPVSNAVSF